MVSLATPVYVSVRALTDRLGPDISRGLQGSRRGVQRNGEDLGRAFSQGFNRGIDTNIFRRVSNGLQSMVPGAVESRKAFASLVRTSYTLSTALVGVVGGASSVISSLGALVGAAGGAISTVSVLGNAFFALGSGMAAVRLATGGIGGALQKLRQQTSAAAATSTRTALQSVRDNQARELATRRIEDAERALARVVEGNREKLVRANQEIEDAQRALNQAIRDGREELQQVGFEAEDAALAEQRAALELDRAREVLARTQDLPPNDRRRREAELAYQEAELNYRKAADANADLQRESDRLARTGVNGLSSVIAAREKVADAEADKAQVIKDALQDEEDALRNVAEARQDAANVDERQDAAGASPAAGVAAAGAAWDQGLNDAQRRFALFINSLRPQFDELERIAAEAFLPRLQTAIEILMEKAYPVVAVGIGVVATAMGEAAITLANFITTSENLEKLAVLFDSSGRLIETFGSILGRSYGIILSILQATAPMAERFFGFLDTELGKFDDFLNSVEGNAALVDFFARAEFTAKQFGDVFGNVFRGIGGIISANIGPGTGGALLLEYFEKATSDWGNSEGLQTFFLNVATNATKVLDTIGSLLGILGRLGENQNIGRAFEVLLSGAPALENILQITADAMPQLAQLLVTVTNIVSAMSDTGALQVFFDTLNTIFGAVLGFVSDPGNKEFLDFFGRIFAVFSAVGFTAGLVTTGLRIATGTIVGLISPIATAVTVTSNLVGRFSAFNALRGATITTANGITGQLTVLGTAARVVTGNTEGMSRAFQILGAPARGLGTAFSAVGSAIGVAGQAVGAFGRALLGVMLGPVGIVIGVIAGLVGLFVLLYNTNDQFKKDMDRVWAQLSATFMQAGQDILDSLMPLIDIFADLVSELAPLVSMIITALVPVFTTLVSAIAPLITMLVSALVPVITTLVSAIVPLISVIISALVPVINVLVQVLSFLIQIIAAVLTVVIQVFTAILTFVIDALVAIISGVVDFISNFGENWDSFWSGVGGFFEDVWNNIMGFFNDALQWVLDLFLNWTIYGIIIQNWDAIVAFFQDVWNNIMGFFDAAFKWIDTYVIQPMIYAGEILGLAFQIMGRIIGDVWQNIQNAINAAWQWIDRYIFNPIRIAVAAIQEYFRLLGVGIDLIWQGIQTAINNAWKWIDTNVFTPIKTAVGLVQQAFENVAQGIATAWDGIKRAAAVPINFVIDTVYNNGLRSFWNDLAGTLGMNNLKLPRVNTIAFASGGVLPGYTPGRDVHQFYSPTAGRLLLSGGEAIMRPEWVRAVGGPRAVESMNRAARGGSGVSGTGTRAFAGGGILDFAGDALNFLGGIGAVIGDFFSDPKKAIEKHLIEGVLKPLLGSNGDSGIAQLAGGIPLKIATSIGDAITKFFETSPPSGSPAGALGWQTMYKIVKEQFPSATLNDALRPAGTQTAGGGLSYHSLGRAIDVPARMEIFDYLAKAFPNSTELIFSPAGGRQLRNGRPYLWGEPVRSMHYNHVHWAMANGGTVMPSPGGSIVNIAEAGQPERVEPLDPNGISERDKAWAKLFTQDMPRGDVNITVVQRENEDTEAFAQRVAEIVNNDIRMGSTR